MSIVILATKGSTTEQFGKFIEHLGNAISAYNSETGKAVDQNDFCTKANQILQANNLSGLITHILTLGDVLIHDSRGIEIDLYKHVSCCQLFHYSCSYCLKN